MAQKYTIQVLKKIQETPQVLSCHCTKPGGFTYIAGQYFFLSLEYNGQLLRKPLSFSSTPIENTINFSKRISQSIFSQALMQLQPGDSVTIEGPLGNFTLPEKPAQLVFIAGGIGITPFRSMLLENARTNQYKITLLYGNNSGAEIIFKKELEQFNVHHQLGNTITADFIKQSVPALNNQNFYVCGSPAMVTAICKILQNELCVSDSMIKIEKLAGY